MKHPKNAMLILVMSATGLFSAPAMASEPKKVTVDQANLGKLPPADQERVLAIADRMESITAIDRGTLTRNERHALRTEWKDLRREVNTYNRRAGGNVVYISTAGIIIIVLLLIILL